MNAQTIRRRRPVRIALALAIALIAVGILAAPAEAGGGWVLGMRASGHTPKVGRPWRIVVTARTTRGAALRGSIRYDFYWHGFKVASRGRGSFTGTFRETLRWPKQSAGRSLIMRVVVSTSRGTKHVDYWIKVHS